MDIKSKNITSKHSPILYMLMTCTVLITQGFGQTVAHWTFDEAQGLYPSHVIDDSSPNDYPLVIGRRGKIVKGKKGNALDLTSYYDLVVPQLENPRFGTGGSLPVPKGRTSTPLHWSNADFGALMTAGEKHLRKQVGFVNPSKTKLNLGHFDWTVEFWYKPLKQSTGETTVFEIGKGPLREANEHTALVISENRTGFVLRNAGIGINIKSLPESLRPGADWTNFSFVYNASKNSLAHFVNGKRISTTTCSIHALAHGGESYFTLGTNGYFEHILPGAIDEMVFYEGIKRRGDYKPKEVEDTGKEEIPLKKGLPLLFSGPTDKVLALGSRKHLFIDGAFFQELDDKITFVANPPRRMERVIDSIKGSFRKHLTVLEDADGRIRLYNSLENDYLAVRVSDDGIHFGSPKIVIPQINGGMGNPFIDPNGPDRMRYKYLSNYHKRGVYLYTSPDGLEWSRTPTAILSFRPGSQSCTFYDDQTQEYVSYHRTDMLQTPGKATMRASVLVRTNDITKPVSYNQLSYADYTKASDTLSLRDPQPWFMDNGPLTPGGFGLEFPLKFLPDPEDPMGTDIYVTKAQKYEWAPDTYLAFPIMYFHYNDDGPNTRIALMDPKRLRGEGPLETQLSVSRDGIHWQRYPRPVYIGIGKYLGKEDHTAYLAHGMVRRGDEIWQYYFAETQYHSAYTKEPEGRSVYRVIQRLDGFVSMDSPYHKAVEAISRPFVFSGKRLHLNVDTDATGYVQIGFLDHNGKAIKGYSVDECIYINGDFVDTQVEWLSGKDVSSLAGREVKLVFRVRGSKVYSFQFKE